MGVKPAMTRKIGSELNVLVKLLSIENDIS